MVTPGDVEELTMTMGRILKDETLWKDLREQGLKRASLFSWERTARQTLKAYEILAE
jgi:glycosyltransferase involved in cell wall biosynthesis